MSSDPCDDVTCIKKEGHQQSSNHRMSFENSEKQTKLSRNHKRSKSKSNNNRLSRAPLRKVIGNYTLVSTIGSGSMGKVKLAVHNLTHDSLAVKIVPRSFGADQSKGKHNDKKSDESREIRTVREANIMLLLYHPHIVSLKEMVILDSYYYLFMEHVSGGQLLDYIIAHGKLKEKQARRFARQILSALDYCHRNSIVHRDLKIENILISHDGHVKIIDFGLSNLFSPRSHLSTFCGSLYFAAPELLHAKVYVGPEVDVWSLGVVLYVLVCGKVPFDDQNINALHAKIKKGHVEYPSHLSSDCKDLLSQILVVNPHHRATVSEIMVHPWMNKGYNGPVDNHLPDRAPLTLPIDTEVIRNMNGFGFGTEEEIRQKLETIIKSEEYQKAAKTLAQCSADLHRRHHRPLESTRLGHAQLPGKKTYAVPRDDPQSIPAAYHPIVSIYYLVKERIERESREAANENAGNGSNDAFMMPSISLPEVAHPAEASFEHSPFAMEHDPQHNARRFFSKTKQSDIFHRNGRMGGSGNIADTERPNLLEGGLYRLFNRPIDRQSESSSTDSVTGGKEQPTMLRRLSLVLHRASADQNNRNHKRRSWRKSIDATSIAPGSPHDGAASDALPCSKLSVRDMHANDDSIVSEKKKSPIESFGHKVSSLFNMTGNTVHDDTQPRSDQLQRQQRQPDSNVEHPVIEDKIPSGKAPAQTLPQFPNNPNVEANLHKQAHAQSVPSASSLQGTADETIRPVFLKGLFSVTTTSTKHPSVIRADLIRILERSGVQWRENKSSFECVHMPSIDMKRVVGDNKATDNTTSSNGSVTVPDLVVRFEICIVKVPWLLGMYGLQFKRVSGDSTLYKNMCSRIMTELKL